MSTTLTAEQQLKAAAAKSGKNEPPHVLAVFGGLYYKGSNGMLVKAPFEQTVKIPLAWVYKEGLDPIFIFANMFAKRLLGALDPEYSSTATIYLKSSSGLPEDLSRDKKVEWTADYRELVALSKTVVGQFALQNDDGTFQKMNTVTIRADLFANSDSLREAIQDCVKDCRAFDIRQTKLAAKTNDIEDIESELRALGY